MAGIVKPVQGYAQTNLQLYAQLNASGWTGEELALAASGYELAMEICGGTCRSNGKPFLCHLVGTASIVGSWGAPRGEVICGLLHSAYSHGAFSDARPGMTDAKRAAVREAVGSACEALIADYVQLPWKRGGMERWAGRIDSLTDGQRTAIRVRLANELEDHLDLGMRLSRKRKYDRPLSSDHPLLVLAEGLVGADFARELASAIAVNVVATVPAALVREDDRSFRLAS